MPSDHEYPVEFPEKLYTIKEAAKLRGLPYFKVQRAVKAGQIASYRLYNGRRLIRLSDLDAAINASRVGGQS